MADPRDLQEAADAIHEVRALPAVQRHKELEDPLRQAEDWARTEYRKVRDGTVIRRQALLVRNRTLKVLAYV